MTIDSRMLLYKIWSIWNASFMASGIQHHNDIKIRCFIWWKTIITESQRLNPILGIFSKLCTKEYTLPPYESQKEGVKIQPGTTVIIPVRSIHLWVTILLLQSCIIFISMKFEIQRPYLLSATGALRSISFHRGQTENASHSFILTVRRWTKSLYGIEFRTYASESGRYDYCAWFWNTSRTCTGTNCSESYLISMARSGASSEVSTKESILISYFERKSHSHSEFD